MCVCAAVSVDHPLLVPVEGGVAPPVEGGVAPPVEGGVAPPVEGPLWGVLREAWQVWGASLSRYISHTVSLHDEEYGAVYCVDDAADDEQP